MPPRRKAAAAAEAIEPTESRESRVERASRPRRAPVRFQSSQNATSRRGAKRQRLVASPTETLEERMQACKREVRYVANYTYDHIGQAVQDADPPVWVDVVPLRLSKVRDVHVCGSICNSLTLSLPPDTAAPETSGYCRSKEKCRDARESSNK